MNYSGDECLSEFIKIAVRIETAADRIKEKIDLLCILKVKTVLFPLYSQFSQCSLRNTHPTKDTELQLQTYNISGYTS